MLRLEQLHKTEGHLRQKQKESGWSGWILIYYSMLRLPLSPGRCVCVF